MSLKKKMIKKETVKENGFREVRGHFLSRDIKMHCRNI